MCINRNKKICTFVCNYTIVKKMYEHVYAHVYIYNIRMYLNDSKCDFHCVK